MALTSRQAKQAHGRLAWFLLIFIAVHFVTHFSGPFGVETHSKTLGWARLYYQFPLIEIALVLALAAQVILGIKLLLTIRKRKRKDAWHWVQFASAAYLAYFIIQHTAAALVTRLAIGLDTNFYWAAGTLALSPIKYYFAPYYTLAVVAIASHLIAALHFRGPKIWHAPALMLGPAVGVVFVLVYGGAFASVDIPQQYLDYYAEYLGAENALTPR